MNQTVPPDSMPATCHGAAVVTLRRGETEQRFDQFRKEFTGWLADTHRLPFASLLDTPLQALAAVIGESLGRIERELDGVAALSAKGAVYAKCQLLDDKLVWTRRVFEFFREKIDQRRRPSHAAFLAAADEVVWSCYSSVFELNNGLAQVTRRATPLPYIETYYTPRVVPVGARLAELEFRQDPTFFERCLAELPIPLIGVPADSLNAPWSLAVLGHEVGHHVQFLLLPRQALVAAFQASVERSVRAAEASSGLEPSPSRSARWGKWGKELFADLHAVAQFGEAAAWVIHDLLWTDDDRMWCGSEHYPPPGLRNAVLQAACDAFQIRPDPALAAWRLDVAAAPGDLDHELDLRIVPRFVAQIVDDQVAGCASLRQLARAALPDFQGDAREYASQLVSAIGAEPPQGEAVTRQVVGAGVRAWAVLAAAANSAGFSDQRARLATNLSKALVGTRKSTLRAEEQEFDPRDAARRFGDLLDAEVKGLLGESGDRPLP